MNRSRWFRRLSVVAISLLLAGLLPATVMADSATVLVVSGSPTTVVAGSLHDYTVTAKDGLGNVDPTYTGIVHLTVDSGDATLGPDHHFTSGAGLNNGVFVFTDVALDESGARILTAADTVTSTITGDLGLTVTPAPATHFVVSGFPASVVAGSSHSVTVTAKDTYSNTDTNYGGIVNFTSTGGAAILPSDTTLSSGTGSFSATLKTVVGGSKSITATDTVVPGITGVQTGISVTPAAATRLVVTGTGTIAAGSAHSYTVTATDPYGNTDPTYTDSVVFTDNSGGSLPMSHDFVSGNLGVHAFDSVSIQKSGSWTLTASDSGHGFTGTLGITVDPLAATNLVVTGSTANVAGSPYSYTVTAQDTYGNTAEGYTGTVRLSVDSGDATLGPDHQFTSGAGLDNGVFVFTGVALKLAGSRKLTATDIATSSISGDLSIDVIHATVDEFVVTASTGSTNVSAAISVTVTAKDGFGNIVTDYTGLVHFISTDGSAVMPGNHNFIPADNGVYVFPAGVIFMTAGTQTVTANGDEAHGTSGAITVGQGSQTISFSSTQPSSATVGGPTYTVIATATSGLTVTFSIDSTSTGFCSVVGSVVSFTAVGTCRVNADQAGNANWSAAPQNFQSFAVAPPVATQLVVTIPPNSIAGAAFTFDVTAEDAGGNIATGYTGDVTIGSSDNTFLSVPTHLVLTAGFGSFQVILYKAGSQTVTATDAILIGTGTTTVTHGAYTGLVLSPAVQTITAGASQSYTATAHDAWANAVDATTFTTFSISGGGSCFGASCASSVAGDHTVTGTYSGQSGQATLHVIPAPATQLTVGGLGSPRAIGLFGNLSVTAFDQYGNLATNYTGTIHFTSNDGTAKLPANSTLSSGAGTFSVAFQTVGTWWVTATDTVTGSITGSQLGIVATTPTPATYYALTPARILDSRDGTGGLSGAFSSHVARTFQVPISVVPAGATAVTGNLTVTSQTSGGFLFMGPLPMNDPTSSTLNFPVGDDRANAVTVALGAGGTLSVTYVGSGPSHSAHAIFDVTGYFMPDNSGATFHALAPARILDSRGSTGGMPGKFTSHVARTFQVSSRGNVPANATAVTGNLTVTGQTANGYLYIGPVPKNNPTSSTLNFPFADDRANAVTVALGAGGALSVTYVGPGASQGAYVIFDVTGYFTQDLSGAKYVPLTPARILDSRDNTGGLPGAFGSHTARTFYVAGRGGVLTNATAVTGNLTVTGQTANGFFFIGPNPTNDPTSSTLNFPAGDDRANAVTVALGTGGTLSVTLVGRTAYAIFDVTGYFVGP